jgi:hypothetical protein
VTNEQMRLTADGNQLLKNWKNTRDRVERLERELRMARNDLATTANAFGKWLSPPDAKDGEVFYVWIGSSLVGAKALAGIVPQTYEVEVRSKGEEWNTL